MFALPVETLEVAKVSETNLGLCSRSAQVLHHRTPTKRSVSFHDFISTISPTKLHMFEQCCRLHPCSTVQNASIFDRTSQ